MGVIKSCISRFFSVIRLTLFLTSLLKHLEENSTVLMLTKLKKVLLRGAGVQCGANVDDVDLMCMLCGGYVDDVDPQCRVSTCPHLHIEGIPVIPCLLSY